MTYNSASAKNHSSSQQHDPTSYPHASPSSSTPTINATKKSLANTQPYHSATTTYPSSQTKQSTQKKEQEQSCAARSETQPTANGGKNTNYPYEPYSPKTENLTT